MRFKFENESSFLDWHQKLVKAIILVPKVLAVEEAVFLKHTLLRSSQTVQITAPIIITINNLFLKGIPASDNHKSYIVVQLKWNPL